MDIEGYKCDAHAGVAGWNDFSECSHLARASLTSAAGISVPDRSLIILALGLYLFVLVPANWTIFRALGRVEWAWAAVPLIALIGTIAVVRLARLDIGFARSRTEIAVVETQPDYSRAHVTRYIGLYTSLSTDYELSFADDSAVAAPLSSGEERFAASRSASKTVVLERTSKRGANVQLRGLSVNSNSTEMIHSEQMMDLGGAIRLGERPGGLIEIINQTPYDLLNVAALRRRRGNLEFAGLRLLKTGDTLRIQFRSIDDDQLMTAWQEVGAPSVAVPDGLEMNALQRLAANSHRLNEGDVLLIAWSDTLLPDLTIKPVASQQTSWTLWVAHLRYGELPAPRSDSNSPTDYSVEANDDRTD